MLNDRQFDNSVDRPEAPLRYVLITPARNEAAFLEPTIASVVAQTVLPLKWVIVSDGSTDGTDDLVARYCARHDWMELLRLPERKQRHFTGKVMAVNAGLARVKDLPYEAIACMDADITFGADYFSFLLQKLSSDPALGIVGTPFLDKSGYTYDYRFSSLDHVSGACQVFRRKCFEDIGGYVPVGNGGIDCIAVTTARMKGWRTRTFPDRVYLHHRLMSGAQCGPLRAKARLGAKDFSLGNHPVWELFRCAYQMSRKPFVLGGVALGAGYLWAMVGRRKRPVSSEFIAFRRREQMRRLKEILRGRLVSAAKDSAMQNSAADASTARH